MTDQTPEPEILIVGEPPPEPGETTAPGSGAATSLLLVLWLVAAAALAAAPFWAFVKYEVTNEGEVVSEYSANGWGVVSLLEDDPSADWHAPRWGVVLVLLAAALVLAVIATVLRRAAAWPARLGALASAMTVAVGAVLLLDQEAWHSNESSDRGLTFDVATGAGMGIALGAAVVAAVALVIALITDRRLSR